MTALINLLSWQPGHSGFGSYVQRVVPELDGLRLQLGRDGQGQLVPASQWTTESPPWAPPRSMRFLQRYSLVQHGLDLPALLHLNGLRVLISWKGSIRPFLMRCWCGRKCPSSLLATTSRRWWPPTAVRPGCAIDSGSRATAVPPLGLLPLAGMWPTSWLRSVWKQIGLR